MTRLAVATSRLLAQILSGHVGRRWFVPAARVSVARGGHFLVGRRLDGTAHELDSVVDVVRDEEARAGSAAQSRLPEGVEDEAGGSAQIRAE